MRVVGIASLGWGVIALIVSSTVPVSPDAATAIHSSVDATIVGMFAGWLVSSGLVKLGMILRRGWVRIATISTVLFVFLVLNVGALTNTGSAAASTAPPPLDLSYAFLSSWFGSWFWIDAMIVLSAFFAWVARKRHW